MSYLWKGGSEWDCHKSKHSGEVFHCISHGIPFHTFLHIQLKEQTNLRLSNIRPLKTSMGNFSNEKHNSHQYMQRA